ncbi:MAG: calcium/sodium antiporter [Planctomycetota bacterium]
MDLVTAARLVGGLVALLVGADLLVRGAAALARRLGVGPLVVGLTVVAFGTSAPEVAVSVGASLRGAGDLALGNVIGSNTFNVLFILGLSSLVAPLVVHRRIVRIDLPLLLVLTLAVVALSRDGSIGRGEGIGLLAGLLLYVLIQIRGARAEEPPEGALQAAPAPLPRSLLLVGGGLGLLVFGADLFVTGASALAAALGVDERVIGLTIVSAGTSLPEVATSVVAAARGERDIAVGNVVGSNVFNLLGVLGAAAVTSSSGLPVADATSAFDIPVMLGATIVVVPLAFSGGRLARGEGLVLLLGYAAYATYLVLAETDVASLPGYRDALLGVGLPLLVMAVALSVWPRRRPS